METVTADEPAMLRPAQKLLHKFGMAWVKAIKEKHAYAASKSCSPASSLEHISNTGSPGRAHHSYDQRPNKPRRTLFELPPLLTSTGHTSTTNDWLGNPIKQRREKGAPPRREYVRAISVMLQSTPANGNIHEGVSPVLSKRPYSTRGKGKSKRFVDYDMSSSEEGISSSHENYVLRNEDRAMEDDASFRMEKQDQVSEGDGVIIIESKQRALVQELLSTVLKTIAQLATCGESSSGSLQVNSKDLNSAFEGMMAEANKLLDGFNWNVGKSLPNSGASRKVKTELFPSGLDEGKRRYKLVPWCVCFECEKQGVDPLQPPKGRISQHKWSLHELIYIVYVYDSHI